MSETQDKTTELRLQVLNNGFTPLPNRQKACFVPGWPKMEVTEEAVRGWAVDEPRAKDTGIRCDTIAAVDRDIEDAELMAQFDAVLRAYFEEQGLRAWLQVTGNKPKDKLVFAVRDEVISTGCSGKYVRATQEEVDALGPDDDLPGPTAMVEILGRGRQIGGFGACKKKKVPVEGGFVLESVEYQWENGVSPATVGVDALSTLTRGTAADVLSLFDTFMEEQDGWVRLTRGHHSLADMATKADLTPDYVIEGAEGRWTVAELKALGDAKFRITLGGKGRDNAEIKVEGGRVTFLEYLAPAVRHVEPWSDTEATIGRLADALGKARVLDPRSLENGLKAELRYMPDLNETAKGGVAASQPASLPNIQTILDVNRLTACRNVYTQAFRLRCGDGVVWSKEAENNPNAQLSAVVDAAQRVRIRNAGQVEQAVVRLSELNQFNPVEDWLACQEPWDGRDRFPELLGRFSFAEGSDEALSARLIRMWLLQLHKAVTGWRTPSSLGYVLVLIGPQGVGKSRFAWHLLPESLAPYNEGVVLRLTGGTNQERDATVAATSAPIAELSELPATKMQSTSDDLKAFLTRPVDLVTMKYDRLPTEKPRATVFIATTNRVEALKDATGSRRFWPVPVDRIADVSNFAPEGGLEAWQGQLWRQVEAWAKEGEVHWPDDALARRIAEMSEDFQDEGALGELLREKLVYEDSARDQLKGAGTDTPEQCYTASEVLRAIGYIGVNSRPNDMDYRATAALLTKHIGPAIPRLTAAGQRKKKCWHIVFRPGA